MALFSQYAIAASEEALRDAGWMPTNDQQRERTVDIVWPSRDGAGGADACTM